jgi:hypothetical protein
VNPGIDQKDIFAHTELPSGHSHCEPAKGGRGNLIKNNISHSQNYFIAADYLQK